MTLKSSLYHRSNTEAKPHTHIHTLSHIKLPCMFVEGNQRIGTKSTQTISPCMSCLSGQDSCVLKFVTDKIPPLCDEIFCSCNSAQEKRVREVHLGLVIYKFQSHSRRVTNVGP